MKLVVPIFVIMLVSGCISEDIEETLSNTTIRPEYSLPVGHLTYAIGNDFSGPGSSVPGIYGIDFYNNIPYPVNSPHIYKEELQNFNFQLSNNAYRNIESLSFRVVYLNSLPTEVVTQIYLLDLAQNVTDSVNHNGKIIIPAAITDQEGIVISPKTTIYDFPFTKVQIDNFPNIGYYFTQSYISTLSAGNDSVKFFSTSQLDVQIGMCIKMKISINSL
jgi:hypothetical protein